MEPSLRRTLLRRWIRGAVSIGSLLLMPKASMRLQAALDPHREQHEIAQALERQQRAGGVRYVTDAGQTVRAVVYSPIYPSAEQQNALHRSLVWWSRLLVVVVALGLLRGTWQLLRQAGGSHSSRPATHR